MKIRSITCFYDPGARHAPQTLSRLGALANTARQRLESAGYVVQTLRLATIPFPRMVPTCCNDSLVQLAQSLGQAGAGLGFDYVSVGPALPDEPGSYPLIPAILAAAPNLFCSGVMASPEAGISLPAVDACARVIAEAASLEPDGFANLRFAALGNVPSGSPFFPAAYHQPGMPPAFALAMECADVALAAFRLAPTVEEGRRVLVATLEEHARALDAVLLPLAGETGFDFLGYDFSPAPHPDPACSLGAALEAMGAAPLGQMGSLAAAALLADALDRGRWRRTGFNGLMLPVLEDAVLARRAAEGTLTVRDLLLFSAVCGAGLDTVPLPGDVTAGELQPLLLDVAALSLRLNKPLTARLMPIPGKKAGDATTFTFDYFANGAVMDLPARPLAGGLADGQATLALHPRPVR